MVAVYAVRTTFYKVQLYIELPSISLVSSFWTSDLEERGTKLFGILFFHKPLW